jgi:2-dehydropantoate 2-reductase
MAPEGAICTVQNSINDETIAELIGADKVIHCVTLWGGSNIGPGKLEQTSLSPFCIGEYGENKNTTRISTLKQILGNVTKTKIFNNILQAAWRKLVLNGVLNTYGLIFGERSYVIFNNPQILPLVLATMREETCIAQDIVGELGKESVISIDKFGIDLNSPLSEIQKNAFACKIMTTVNGRIKSSMLQDYEHGIKTENEYLAGYFIRENQKNAEHKKKDPFAIPFIQRSFEIAQKVENGDLNPNLENLQYFTDLIETLPTTWQNPENFKLDNTKQKLKLALYGILGSLIVGK